MFVTSSTPDNGEVLAEVAAALRQLDLDVTTEGGALVVDGIRLPVHVVVRAHPTPADLAQLAGGSPGSEADGVILVADRISEPGRDLLRQAGWGWLDRRGHVRIWTTGVRLDAPVPEVEGPRRSRATNPWTEVGLEIALAALLHPDEPVTARRVAPVIGRSVGATHELIARFTELGLVGPATRGPLLPELFWETAAHWPDDGWRPVPVGLVELAEQVGGAALLRVDERAATLGGARIPAAGDLPARCYVTDAAAWRRARSLFERDAPTRGWVRRPPIRWLPENEEHPPDEAHPWRLAHPILCALRLAADPARGREIVDDWGIVPQAPA